MTYGRCGTHNTPVAKNHGAKREKNVDWSEWENFAECGKQHRNPAQECPFPGVYCIRATVARNQPKPIPRAIETDPNGILYFGETGNLLQRIGSLETIYDENTRSGHDFADTYLVYELSRLCNRNLLEISWMECNDYKSQEIKLLREYKKQFGDIPPGNVHI